MRGTLRRTSIMDRIRRDGAVSVGELAKELDVSVATIHRDLRALTEEGLVERVDLPVNDPEFGRLVARRFIELAESGRPAEPESAGGEER